MLNKLLCALCLSLFALSFFHSPVRAYVEPLTTPSNTPSIQFEVNPRGPLNLGDGYEIKAVVTLDGTHPCQNCPVQWRFLEDPQPGDELHPYGTTTSDNGEALVSAVSYAVPDTGYRQLSAKVTLPSGIQITSDPVNLQYHNRPIFGFIRLVTELVKKGYVLPPFGNVYPKATEQTYTGGQKREIFLEWNRPFGARRFDISVAEGKLIEEYGYFKDKTIVDSITGQPAKSRHIKSVSDTKTSIKIDAFKDIQILVDACTTGDSCVGGWTAPIVAKLNSTSQTGTFPIPNFGIENPEKYKKMQEEEEGFLSKFLGPLTDWFKGVYNLF